MVIRRNQQRTIYEGMISGMFPDGVQAEWEPWMREVDRILAQDELIDLVQEALAKRHPRSRSRGRNGTPAEVALRLLVLKHMKRWSYAELEQEVRGNFIYREFTRVGMGKVPDEKTMVRLGQAIGPEIVAELNRAIVGEAKRRKVVRGRKMRTDTTVVETNIHYPTDSQLMADGVRVITRLIKKMEEKVGQSEKKFRNRMRSIGHHLISLGKAAAQRGEKAQAKRELIYRKLLRTTRRVVGEAESAMKRIEVQVEGMADRTRREAIVRIAIRATEMIALTERVLKQTRARVIDGNTHYDDKLLSVFETHTETIRKGKAGKPNEFGKMVKIQEAENQIITDYEVYDERPPDQHLLIPAIEKHIEIFGRAPALVAADAGFSSRANERRATELGVKQLAVPGRGSKKKARWFRRGQRWRVGCEGRISVLKRRCGLSRSRYKGPNGMRRWVGLGVVADNLISIARATSSG